MIEQYENFMPFTFNLIEIDEDLTKKKKVGEVELITLKSGSQYELTPQEGILKTPSHNSPYKKGDVVIFEHMVSDQKTDMFGGVHYFSNDEMIIGYKHTTQEKDNVGNTKTTTRIKSHNRIICKEIKEVEETSEIIITLKKEKAAKQMFEVMYSPFDGYKKGDIILVKEEHDYPIERLKVTFVKPEDVIKNITEGKVKNEFTIVKVLKEEDQYIESESGLFLPSETFATKGTGIVIEGAVEELIGQKIYFVKGYKFTIDDNEHRAILSEDILGKV